MVHNTIGNIAKDHGKEFEGSYTRVIFLMCITYCTLYGYMSLIGTHNAALNAIVPTIGFNISTWSLPFVKNLWIYFKENTGGLERTGDATTYGTSDDIDV